MTMSGANRTERRSSEKSVTNDSGTTSNLRVAGSSPAGPANRGRSSAVRAEERFATKLSSHPNTIAANADGTTAQYRDDPWGSTPHPCGPSLARAGFPGFRHSWRRDHRCLANAGRTTGSALAARREVGCSNHSIAARRCGAVKAVLPTLAAKHRGRMQSGLQDRAPGTCREVGRSSRPSHPQGRDVAQKTSWRVLSPDRKDE